MAIDGSDGKIYFGGKADWFSAPPQRPLREGAVVAAEILSYLAATRDNLWDLYPPGQRRTQAEFEGLAEKVQNFISPYERGQVCLSGFVDGLTAYTDHAGHRLVFNVLDIPADRSKRPSADRCEGFIDDAMNRDSPVAFLTRSHGSREGEVVYHWSLIVRRSGSKVLLADNGTQTSMDFRLWHDTTTLGGGLVFVIRKPL